MYHVNKLHVPCNEVKLYLQVTDAMIERYYKYNSGGKKFTQVIGDIYNLFTLTPPLCFLLPFPCSLLLAACSLLLLLAACPLLPAPAPCSLLSAHTCSPDPHQAPDSDNRRLHDPQQPLAGQEDQVTGQEGSRPGHLMISKPEKKDLTLVVGLLTQEDGFNPGYLITSSRRI